MTHKRVEEIKEACQMADVLNPKIEPTSNGHYRITSESLTRKVHTSSTPSDKARAYKNLASELKKYQRGALSRNGHCTIYAYTKRYRAYLLLEENNKKVADKVIKQGGTVEIAFPF